MSVLLTADACCVSLLERQVTLVVIVAATAPRGRLTGCESVGLIARVPVSVERPRRGSRWAAAAPVVPAGNSRRVQSSSALPDDLEIAAIPNYRGRVRPWGLRPARSLVPAAQPCSPLTRHNLAAPATFGPRLRTGYASRIWQPFRGSDSDGDGRSRLRDLRR